MPQCATFGDPDDAVDLQLTADSGDRAIYLYVLKQLVGREMRHLLRDELRSIREEVRTALSRLSPIAEVVDPYPGVSLDSQDEDEASRSPSAKTPQASTDRDVGCSENAAIGTSRPAQMDLSLTFHALSQEQDPDEEDEVLPGWTEPARSLVRTLDSWLAKLGTMEAPNQPKCLRGFLQSYFWGSLVNLVIVMNCAFLVYSANHQMQHYMDQVAIGSALFWCDIAFLCFFGIEFCLNLVNYRWYYFVDKHWKSNWLAFILLVVNLASVRQASQNYTFRLLRVFRLLKLVRTLRSAARFNTLRAIVTALADSVWTFFWSLAMLALVYFMFALVFVSRVAAHVSEKGPDLDVQEHADLRATFGSIPAAMESLIMSSTGGKDWGDDYALLGTTGGLNQAIFMLFVFFIQVALMNILLGVFANAAMKSLEPDEYQKAHQLAFQRERLEDELFTWCAEVGHTSGKLNPVVWNSNFNGNKKRELLDVLSLPAHQMRQIFKMMCAESLATRGENNVEIPEFVNVCLRMMDPNSIFHIYKLLFELGAIKESVLTKTQQNR